MVKHTKKILTAVSLLALCSGQLCAMKVDGQDSVDKGGVSPRSTQAVQSEEPSAPSTAVLIPSSVQTQERDCAKFLAAVVGFLRGDFSPVPAQALGHEKEYYAFRRAKLVYRPILGSDKGKLEWHVASLADPLDGTFDLSKCGRDIAEEFTIGTGYPKEERLFFKMAIRVAPYFVIQNNLAGNTNYLQPIMSNWNTAEAPVAVFWTQSNPMEHCNYLITQSTRELSSGNLYQKLEASTVHAGQVMSKMVSMEWCGGGWAHLSHRQTIERQELLSRFTFELK